MKQLIASIAIAVLVIALTIVTFNYISKLGNKPNSEITER